MLSRRSEYTEWVQKSLLISHNRGGHCRREPPRRMFEVRRGGRGRSRVLDAALCYTSSRFGFSCLMLGNTSLAGRWAFEVHYCEAAGQRANQSTPRVVVGEARSHLGLEPRHVRRLTVGLYMSLDSAIRLHPPSLCLDVAMSPYTRACLSRPRGRPASPRRTARPDLSGLSAIRTHFGPSNSPTSLLQVTGPATTPSNAAWVWLSPKLSLIPR